MPVILYISFYEGTVILGNTEMNLSRWDQFTQNPSLSINPVACVRLPSIS